MRIITKIKIIGQTGKHFSKFNGLHESYVFYLSLLQHTCINSKTVQNLQNITRSYLIKQNFIYI